MRSMVSAIFAVTLLSSLLVVADGTSVRPVHLALPPLLRSPFGDAFHPVFDAGFLPIAVKASDSEFLFELHLLSICCRAHSGRNAGLVVPIVAYVRSAWFASSQSFLIRMVQDAIVLGLTFIIRIC
jgi:hypothetical protein